jgi:hypothetical protein
MYLSSDIRNLIRPGMGMDVIDQVSAYDYDYWNGRLLCWEPPESRETYVMGVDPATGVGEDRSVCEVIKLGNIQHPNVQVAEYACDFLDPVDFAAIVNTIGRWYGERDNEAFCAIEVNAECGDTMQADLKSRFEYTNLYTWKALDRVNNIYTNKQGWWTNRTSRPKLIARGLHAIQYSDLIVNSTYCLDEMNDFERDHFIAKAKARHGMHDDRLMALLIAYYCGNEELWLSGEDPAEERRQYQYAKSKQSEQQPESMSGRRVDYQARPLSYAQMMDEANAALLEGWGDD